MAGPYDDDLSEADQAELNKQAESDKTITEAPGGKVPGILEADGDDANAATIAEAEAESAAKAKKAPAADAAAPPAPETDPPGETLQAFIERHKDKPAAELAQLIENREKRQAREGFKLRQRGRSPEAIQADRAALAARRQAIAGDKNALEKAIEEDPDAATRALANHALNSDLERIAQAEAALVQEEHIQRVDQAIAFGAQHITDFPNVYPQMREFAQAVGYTDEEIDGVADGRDLVVLNLARIAGNLILAKAIDLRGNLLPQVQPVAPAPTDPRLTAPRPPATHSGAAAIAAPSQTIEQQINAVLGMSDADFAKLPEAEINRLMGA